MPSNEWVPFKKKDTATTEGADESVEVETPDQPSELIATTDAILDEIDKVLDSDVIDACRKMLASKEEVSDKPFTLADAIREGALCSDQMIGGWTGPQGETCALSAAMVSLKARGLV